jgi:peptide subunit release factor 1 (eRF1)
MTEITLDKLYAEVKRMHRELKSIRKTLDSLVWSLIPEEKPLPDEVKILKARKKEALWGECVPLEEVMKKHGRKESA